MNVTAKGYAELVDLLQADVAVLEGGYSVQEALPYVNTGIILSMAGLVLQLRYRAKLCRTTSVG